MQLVAATLRRMCHGSPAHGEISVVQNRTYSAHAKAHNGVGELPKRDTGHRNCHQRCPCWAPALHPPPLHTVLVQLPYPPLLLPWIAPLPCHHSTCRLSLHTWLAHLAPTRWHRSNLHTNRRVHPRHPRMTMCSIATARGLDMYMAPRTYGAAACPTTSPGHDGPARGSSSAWRAHSAAGYEGGHRPPNPWWCTAAGHHPTCMRTHMAGAR